MEPSSNYSLNLHDRDIYTVYSQITHPPSLSAMSAALVIYYLGSHQLLA